MEQENIIDGIKDINKLLCDKIQGIIEWWKMNVNYIGDRIGHYRLMKLDKEKDVYDIYDEYGKYYIYESVSSPIHISEQCSALIMQFIYMDKIEKLQSLIEHCKKIIDTNDNKDNNL